jgi:hypothetical protein
VSLCAMEFCSVIGAIETALLLILLMVSLTFDSTLQISIRRSAAGELALLLLSLIGCNWVHAVAFFLTLADAGPVFSALLKAIQMVCVFVLSALFFCSLEHPAQCATTGRSFTVMLLAAGLGVYALGSVVQGKTNSRLKVVQSEVV